MKGGQALLVVLLYCTVLLCMCEAGAQAGSETPSLDDVWRELKELKDKTHQLKVIVEEQSQKLKVMDGENAALQNDTSALKTQNSALQNDVSGLKTENSALLAQLSTLEMRLTATEREMEEIKRHNAVPLPDCEEIYNNVSTQSGVYTNNPTAARPAKVYCDMDTDGGKWTVIQRRVDGSVDFYRPWVHYQAGFGNASGEYWLGLDNMHLLTKYNMYQLRVDMEDFEGNTAFASYSSFSVGSEADGYRLQVSGFQDGGAGDSLAYHNGMKFSTFDKDQDKSDENCASDRSGAFWYKLCAAANPNGLYLRGETDRKGVIWYQWKVNNYSLKAVAMKIRRVP